MTALANLKKVLGGDVQKLVTFMCNGIAKRIEDAGFMTALANLKVVLGDDVQNLVTFMCNGVAARIEDEGFMNEVKKLKGLLGGDVGGLATVMCNYVAKRIENPGFAEGLAADRNARLATSLAKRKWREAQEAASAALEKAKRQKLSEMRNNQEKRQRCGDVRSPASKVPITHNNHAPSPPQLANQPQPTALSLSERRK